MCYFDKILNNPTNKQINWDDIYKIII